MHRPDPPPMTPGVILRGVGLAFSIGLGAVGLWLIVTSTEQKHIELGALAEFWALLIGAFALFGSRRLAHPFDDAPAVQVTAQPGAAIELRSRMGELERAEEAASRRDHEERLERLLRQEIHTSVSREVSTLRAEIAQLRSELLEKVGGQLRLEHIETTRVIGSDLEALHDEVRQLKFAAAAESGDLPRPRSAETTSVRHIVEPARVRPVSRQTAEVEADVQPARQDYREPVRYPDPEPAFRAEPEPAPRAEPEPRREPVSPRPAVFSTSERTMPIRMPEPAPARPPAATAAPPPIPTAGIPGVPAAMTPRSAPEAAPAAPPTPAAPPAPAAPPVAAPAPVPAPVPPRVSTPAPARPEPPAVAPPEPRPAPAPPADDFAALPRLRPFTDFELDPIEDEPRYTGRRRRREEVEAARGRHARIAEEQAGRRRAPEDGSEVLAQLLARENSRR